MDLADGPLSQFCLSSALIAIRCRGCGKEVRSPAEAIMAGLAQSPQWSPLIRASHVGSMIRRPCACGSSEFDSRATLRMPYQ